MRDFHKEVISNQIGQTDTSEALESLRNPLVYAMRSGDTFVINLDKTSPDFKNVYNDEDNFPSYKIFDWNEWRDHDTYMKIVRAEEDYDLLKNKNCYFMNAEF